MAAPRPADREPTGSRPRAGLGRPARRRRVPRAGDRLDRRRRRPRQEPGAGSRAACAISPTASTAPTRSTCASGRSPGPTGSSSARSGSTPTAPAPRSSSSPSNASSDGAFKSRGLPEDALTIAIVETGVALRAFDGEQVGRLCIRDAAPGRVAPGPARRARPGTLVIADERGPVGLLFGEPTEWSGDRAEVVATADVAAVQVNGVPQIAVDEALWMAARRRCRARPQAS